MWSSSESDYSSASPGDEDEEVGLDDLSFFKPSYESKEKIHAAVIEYHDNSFKTFRCKRSNKGKLYFLCGLEECPFQLNFNLQKKSGQFKLSENKLPHNCKPHNQTNFKKNQSVKYFIGLEEVSTWYASQKRVATTESLDVQLNSLGHQVSYKQRLRILNHFNETEHAKDDDQFGMLPSYVNSLNSMEQIAYLDYWENDEDDEDENDEFNRLCILYREGLQGFQVYVLFYLFIKEYYTRGLQLDGTHIKTRYGGILLVACFKNGNNNIRLIGIAVVEGESEDSWAWFLSILKEHIHAPSFIISDRDKGLIKAVGNVFEGVEHFFCVRHMLDNFNKRFKDKPLYESAIRLLYAKTMNDFEREENYIESRNEDALKYLKEIGYDKISLLFSSKCRYGTLTSNNAESFNARYVITNIRVRKIRKLPIIEMLLEIERIVKTDRFQDSEMALKWNGDLTKHGETLLTNRCNEFIKGRYTIRQTSEWQFEVTCPVEQFCVYKVPLYFKLVDQPNE